MSEAFEEVIHQARLLSIQGRYPESIQKYNEAFASLSDYVDSLSDERKEVAQRRLGRLIEEIDTVKAAFLQKQQDARFQPQVSTSIPLNQHQEEKEEHQNTYGPMFEDLARAFTSLGRNVRELNEKYKITETCGMVATGIANKTAEIVNSPEVQSRISSIGQSIVKWNETNHVTESIGNALNTVATKTEEVVDKLFPNLVTQPTAPSEPAEHQVEPMEPIEPMEPMEPVEPMSSNPDLQVDVSVPVVSVEPISEDLYDSLPVASVVEVPQFVPEVPELEHEVDSFVSLDKTIHKRLI